MRLSVISVFSLATLLAGCSTPMAPPMVVNSARSVQDEAACITGLFSTRLERVRAVDIPGGREIASVDQTGLIVARVEVKTAGPGSRVSLEVRDFARYFYEDMVHRCAGSR